MELKVGRKNIKNKYCINNVQDMFDKLYYKSYLYDMEALSNYII